MIEIREIYKHTTHGMKIDTVKFCEHIYACLSELSARYGESYVFENDNELAKDSDGLPKSSGELMITDTINIYPEYFGAICAYVSAKTQGSDMSTFIYDADNAYLTVWRRLAKGMRKGRDVW